MMNELFNRKITKENSIRFRAKKERPRLRGLHVDVVEKILVEVEGSTYSIKASYSVSSIVLSGIVVKNVSSI